VCLFAYFLREFCVIFLLTLLAKDPYHANANDEAIDLALVFFERERKDNETNDAHTDQ